MATTEHPGPVLITSGDLISQEEQFIKEYAAYFNLPTNLNRREMLERICQLHPGSTPTIPVLPHLTFERSNGGKIRFTGRVAILEARKPTASASSKPSVPASRRLFRQSERIQAMREAEQPHALSPVSELSSREDSPLPETPVDAAPHRHESDKEEPREDPFNMEHSVNIVLRFPTPVDEFDPPPPRRPRREGSPDSAASSSVAIPPKPRMEFVYPPIPRPLLDAEQNNSGVSRAFSPGDSWVEKMYVDLVRNRKDVVNDLEEVKREVREALEEVTKADLELKGEIGSMKSFIGYLKQIVGKDWTEEILEVAGRIAEEGSSDGESGEDGDEDEADGNGGDDGDDDGQGGGEEGGGGDGESGNDSSGGGSSDGDEGEEEEKELAVDPTGSPSYRFRRSPPELYRPIPEEMARSRRSLLNVEGSRSPSPSPGNSAGKGAASGRRQSHKRKHDADDSNTHDGEPGSSYKRARSSHDFSSESQPIPRPIFTHQTQPSPPRKRSRDDDDSEGSEWEVELSVRRLANEGSSSNLPRQHGSPKRVRFDGGINDAQPRSRGYRLASPPPPRRHLSEGEGDSSRSSSDDEPGESGNMISANAGPSHGGKVDAGQHDDGTAGSVGAGAPSSSSSSGASTAQHARQTLPTSGGSNSQPIAGPSNPRPRPLTRDRERIRETGDGGVEAYVYEEDPDWVERQERHRLQMYARGDYGQVAAFRHLEEFTMLRAPDGWFVEFVSDEDEAGDGDGDEEVQEGEKEKVLEEL